MYCTYCVFYSTFYYHHVHLYISHYKVKKYNIKIQNHYILAAEKCVDLDGAVFVVSTGCNPYGG